MSADEPQITLAPVDRENFRECVRLELAPGQERFVATNVYSIAQSKVETQCEPTVVFADGEMVGFAMYEFEDGEFWISRFMISASHQSRGLGRAAMIALINHIRKHPNCDGSIYLSYVPGNSVAERLYESLGFQKTGKIEDGEIVSRLPAPA